MTSLQKSYRGLNNVKILVIGFVTYEGLDDEEELEMILVINQNNNNYYYLVSDSESNDKAHDNLFDENINNEVEATLIAIVNAKVVWAMKKLQASYNKDANKILEEVAQKLLFKKILTFRLTWPW